MSDLIDHSDRRNRSRLEPRNTMLKIRGKVVVVMNISLGGMMLHWPIEPLPQAGGEQAGTVMPGPYKCDSFFVMFKVVWSDPETRKVGVMLKPAANENMDLLLSFLGKVDAKTSKDPFAI